MSALSLSLSVRRRRRRPNLAWGYKAIHPLGWFPSFVPPLYCHNAIPPSLLPPFFPPPSWSCTYTRPPGEVTKCGVKAKPTPLRRPHVPQGERQGRQEAGIKTIAAYAHARLLAHREGPFIPWSLKSLVGFNFPSLLPLEYNIFFKMTTCWLPFSSNRDSAACGKCSPFAMMQGESVT